MPTETNPYRLADKAIDLLNSRAVKRFEDAKDEAAQKGFDELSVLEVTRTLYQNLARDNQEIFLELAQERYQEAEPHGEEPPDLAWLLAGYSAVTKVIYDNDVDRKRQYTAEGINSSTAKVTEFRRGLHYWADLTATYGDIVTDESTLKAYRDAGVKKVRWVTVGDGKVCEICRERNGKVYSINSIPPKHRRCRCVFEPVNNK
nr:MAG TPA: putative head morphogenesis protein [Caudoviricetes sp.]